MAPREDLLIGEDGRARCWWHGGHADYAHYHDREWGRPVVDDRRLFEKICLEGFQAGLSWLTILRKREHFRDAFAQFDIEEVARFGASDVERLLSNRGIVRHRGKIESTINNAQRARELRDEHGSLARFFWSHEPSAAKRPPLTPSHRRAWVHPRRNSAGERAQATRLVLRRPDDGLRIHASNGTRQRPRRRLLRPRGSRGRT